ncbi:MAG: 4-hydroxythreonine-4-phosphate dehydrogenase PdxA [Microscillaceae bacterium]|nr:4-hydroxythreonine-4-phosphate dehydrogenase PdxA [Microscillaceae bacterium]
MQENNQSFPEEKPVLGISIGDFNGIGPEIILKTLSHPYILKVCTPVVYAPLKVLNHYRKLLNLKEIMFHLLNTPRQINPKKVNLVNLLPNQSFEVQPGQVSPEAGLVAREALKALVQDLKENILDGVVTAPIHKSNIQSDDFRFPGHTEFFTEAFGQAQSLMLLVAEDLRVSVATGHIPLSEVSQRLTREWVQTKAQILLTSLEKDFGIQKPKVAVLGLNPHAGEEGLLGDEEQQIIRPIVLEMKKKGQLLFGPFPADGFFGTGDFKKFDGILAMYHDQGLIPFKTLAFEQGVNFTAGLPIVRTSPDHGTAYSIAGKGIAEESSFREAILLACKIIENRMPMPREEA